MSSTPHHGSGRSLDVDELSLLLDGCGTTRMSVVPCPSLARGPFERAPVPRQVPERRIHRQTRPPGSQQPAVRR